MQSTNFQGSKRAAGLVLLAVTLALAACSSDSRSSAASGGKPEIESKDVTLIPVRNDTFGKVVVATGTLAADEQAGLAFKVPGRLVSIAVDLGSVVRKGDVVARLDRTDYELRVRQAEAALQQARARLGLDPTGKDDSVDIEATGTVRQAKAVLDEAAANRERGQQLFRSGVISKAQLDAYESAYQVAKGKHQDALEEVRNRQAVLLQRRSELDLARQQLADTELRAPYDGAVSERTVTAGEYVAAGGKIATLVRLDPLRLRAEIPEREAAGVRQGQTVQVRAEGAPEAASGRVARLSPVVNAQNRVLVVEVEVDNGRRVLKPGGFARAEIATDLGATALTVPSSAVVSFAGIEKVFTVKDGKALEAIVTTGRRIDDRVEITGGIDAGAQVVESPGNLVTGQPVSVK